MNKDTHTQLSVLSIFRPSAISDDRGPVDWHSLDVRIRLQNINLLSATLNIGRWGETFIIFSPFLKALRYAFVDIRWVVFSNEKIVVKHFSRPTFHAVLTIFH